MIWWTSDWHLKHHNIIKYCGRPFANTEEMDKTIIDNYKAVVKPNDDVFFIGDLSFQKDAVMSMKDLPGRKWLVPGNHDRLSKQTYRDAGFTNLKRFQFIVIELQPGVTQKIFLTHIPPGEDKVQNILKNWDADMCICGHVHEKWISYIDGKGRPVLNCGVDAHNFKPTTGFNDKVETKLWSIL